VKRCISPERGFQSREHRVERIGEAIDLVLGSATLEASAQVLGADPQGTLRHPIDRPERAPRQHPAADRREHRAQRNEHEQRLDVPDKRLMRPAQRHGHLDQIDDAPGPYDRHREQPRPVSSAEVDRLDRGLAAQRVHPRRARERQGRPQCARAHLALRVEELHQGVGKLRAQELAHQRLEVGRQRRGRVRGRRVAEHTGHGEQRRVEIVEQVPAQERVRSDADQEQDGDDDARVPERQPRADRERAHRQGSSFRT
jgi:hypothetical protein